VIDLIIDNSSDWKLFVNQGLVWNWMIQWLDFILKFNDKPMIGIYFHLKDWNIFVSQMDMYVWNKISDWDLFWVRIWVYISSK
jgi:hypothetical protein